MPGPDWLRKAGGVDAVVQPVVSCRVVLVLQSCSQTGAPVGLPVGNEQAEHGGWLQDHDTPLSEFLTLSLL
jgi:hypothetical protein